ncbi:2TM domain-containing protein [Jejudonia soesokkakensis]|uniref:2TM domain-containing protein n=1 Tax=Jejudonia soesokkakensis TaxID=1323432 RepID=A0ABW2MTH6_9FLAO
MKTERAQKIAYAKNRIKEIKDFYSHLLVYIFVNLIIVLAGIGFLETIIDGYPSDFRSWFSWNIIVIPFFWGIGLLFHAAKAFHWNPFFGKQWEARKMKEYLEKEEKIKNNMIK